MLVFQSPFVWIPMVVGALFLAGSCVSVKEQPVATGSLILSAGNRELADRNRLKVLDELAWRPLEEHERAALGEILARVIGSNLHSQKIREKAVEIIVERYGPDAAVWLGKTLGQTTQEPLQQMITALGELGDSQAIAYLIMTLAKMDRKTIRQEQQVIQAIEQIAGRGLSAVLINAWLTPENPLNVRLASLEYLLKSQGKGQMIAELLNRPSDDDDAFLEHLRFWAQHFATLPGDRRDYLQCSWQRLLLGDERLADMEIIAKRHPRLGAEVF